MGMSDVFSGKDLLEAEDVARYLGVRQTTVYRWCREGRLSCLKVGKLWRIRASSLEEFLRHSERPATLSGQLKQFLEVPASIIGIAQSTELLHGLDSAFLQVGEERGAMLVKFHGGEPASADELRKDFAAHGLDVARLERESRLIFSGEKDPLEEREGALQKLVEEQRETGREIWVSFDWAESADLTTVLQQQARLMEFTREKRLAIKTALLEEAADDWPMATQRQAQALHSGLVWLSDSGLALSRMTRVNPG